MLIISKVLLNSKCALLTDFLGLMDPRGGSLEKTAHDRVPFHPLDNNPHRKDNDFLIN
jgi:hypothetical protein